MAAAIQRVQGRSDGGDPATGFFRAGDADADADADAAALGSNGAMNLVDQQAWFGVTVESRTVVECTGRLL